MKNIKDKNWFIEKEKVKIICENFNQKYNKDEQLFRIIMLMFEENIDFKNLNDFERTILKLDENSRQIIINEFLFYEDKNWFQDFWPRNKYNQFKKIAILKFLKFFNGR